MKETLEELIDYKGRVLEFLKMIDFQNLKGTKRKEAVSLIKNLNDIISQVGDKAYKNGEIDSKTYELIA